MSCLSYKEALKILLECKQVSTWKFNQLNQLQDRLTQREQRSFYHCATSKKLAKVFLVVNIPCIVVGINKKNKYVLRLDTSQTQTPSCNLKCFLFTTRGHLLQIFGDASTLCHLWSIPSFIFSLVPPIPPQDNRLKLKHYLKNHFNQNSIDIWFIVSWEPTFYDCWWTRHSKNDTDTLKWFCFTGKDGRIHFIWRKDYFSSNVGIYSRPASTPILPLVSPPSSRQTLNEFSDNRSSAMSSFVSGLTVLFNLGIIRKQSEFETLSTNIANLVPSVWVHLDVELNVRYFAYYEHNGLFKTFTFCNNNSEKQLKVNQTTWTTLFAFLFDRHGLLTEKRKHLMKPYLSVLTPMTRHRGLLARVYRQLLKWTQTTKIILWSKGDVILHQIKLPFAHNYYLFKQNLLGSTGKAIKGFHGIRVMSTNQNTMTELASGQMSFHNLFHMLNEDKSQFNVYEDMDDLITMSNKTDLDNWLYPCPILETAWNKIENIDNIIPYSMGKVVNADHPWHLQKYLWRRSMALCRRLVLLNKDWSETILKYCNLEINSIERLTFSALAFKCVMQRYAQLGGPLHQGIERTKPAYEQLLRSHCHGGFSFSANIKIDKNEPLFSHRSDSQQLQSISEYDLVSSYGYACTKAQLPSKFGIGYSLLDGVLVRSDKKQRHASWEFKCTYATIYQIQQTCNIRTVFHNYSTQGLFTVFNYPVDLAIILENGVWLLFQFDGQFVHGCDTCPSLRHYVGKQNLAQVRLKTSERNRIFELFVQTARECGIKVHYTVITDCHNTNYSKVCLDQLFDTAPLLRALVKPYAQLPKHCLDPATLCRPSAFPDLTFFVFSGAQAKGLDNDNFTQIYGGRCLQWNDQDRLFEWSNQCQNAMFTKDQIQFYSNHVTFELNNVTCVIFYPVCDTMPKIYKELLKKREDAKMTGNILFGNVWKRVVNYSCGFLGLNTNKLSRPKVTIQSRIKQRLHSSIECLDYYKDTAYFLKLTYKANNTRPYKTSAFSVPLFACIIEFGKMRLMECLFILDASLPPLSWRLLYSNIDNLVVGMASPHATDAIDKHSTTLQTLFFPPRQPGRLALQWTTNPDVSFSFISPRRFSYIVTVLDNDNLFQQLNSFYKCPLTNLSINQVYHFLLSVLYKQTSTVHQDRRVNKLANFDWQTIRLKM